jgi:hypothetical protein
MQKYSKIITKNTSKHQKIGLHTSETPDVRILIRKRVTN